MSENISQSFSFTTASSSKHRVPTDQLESVVNEICANDQSGDEIMIPELDEVDNDNTVIDYDPQDSNHEHLATTTKEKYNVYHTKKNNLKGMFCA
jgi:hypothetical protein